jgi:hypothetical protein
MKHHSAYWWSFVVSGSIWAIGFAGIITGVALYPDSNLLGGFGLVFAPIGWLGGSVFQSTLVVWLIHRLMKWTAKRRHTGAKNAEAMPNQALDATSEPAPSAASSPHQG